MTEPWTMLPTVLITFLLGMMTRTIGVPMVVFTLWHFCIWENALGTGHMSEREYDTYYTLAALMFSILGDEMAWALGLPNVFVGKRVPKDNDLRQETDKKAKKRMYARRALCIFYRTAIGVIFLALVVGATMPFEYIPDSLNWLGILLTVVVVILCHVVYFMAYSKNIPPEEFKTEQAVYMRHSTHMAHPDDMTSDVVIYMGAVILTTTLTMCIVHAVGPAWWSQLYTAAVLFGFWAIFFLVAGVSWLNPKTLPGKKYKTIGERMAKRRPEERVVDTE